ncbi:DUF29 domain-containing protein [Pleurocapsa sp. PCC 7319]|uniref:DUF29 domain-containing protein n=1 Tax=Pleurocapsa sp. PCC 7319 TaxID=118161 RepID=UPI0003481653|nr:DUF29 domain-containing protein [Pleurocapsa sp. PCC 7319]
MGNSKNVDQIDRDYIGWLEEQTNKLKSRSFSELDIHNLVEVLETLIRNEKSEIRNLIYQILVNFLLIDYWQEESSSQDYWREEIDNFQYQLSNKMTTNLKNLLDQELNNIYAKARRSAMRISKIENDRFPQQCPYSLAEILDNT